MLSFWQNIPFTRMLIAYISGIVCCYYLPNSINTYFVVSAFSCSFFLFVAAVFVFHKKPVIIGFSAFLLFIVLGFLTFTIHHPTHNTLHFSHYISYDFPCIIKGIVVENPNETANAKRVKLSVGEVMFNTVAKPCEGEVLLYLNKQDSIGLGDEIIAKCNFQPIKPPEFPFEFDFQKHWFSQKIFQQGFIIAHKKIGEKFNIKSWALLWRNKAKHLYEKHFSKTHLNLISALVLGDDDHLDKNIIRDFRDNGTIHILSVSGMHVGIIYVAIVFLFEKLPLPKRLKRLLRFAFIIGLVWMYAFITGLSAPVTRAALMCSFVELGNFFLRKNNLYNNISCAAFLQLLFNPYLIFNIGFQLSYSAVFGLVYILPKLNGIFFHRHKYWNYFIEMTNVTVAAQLATLPFILYYFAQFPVYFIISNIGIGLLSTLAIYGGILFLILYPVSFLRGILAELNAWILELILKISHYISDLPFSVWHFNRITVLETLLLLGFIYLFFYVIKKFAFKPFFALLALLLMLIVSVNVRLLKAKNQREIIQTERKKFGIQAAVLQDKLYIKNKTIKDTAYFEEWLMQLKKYYQISTAIQLKETE